MRMDLTIATDEEYEDQLVAVDDVPCVPERGDIIQVGNKDYKVIERRFQYHPSIDVCDCWIRVYEK